MRQTKSVKSTKERLKELETTASNSQMALQLSQMMVKHLTNQVSALEKDVTNTMGILNDFQYRTLAMLELGNFSKDEINAKADELREIDFNKASDQEDVAKGYEVDAEGIIKEDSIVTITSNTPDEEEDRGIFRSRQVVAGLPPELSKELVGKSVGDKVDYTIDNVKHVIEILGVRKAPPAPEPGDNENKIPPAEDCPQDCNKECSKDCSCAAEDK